MPGTHPRNPGRSSPSATAANSPMRVEYAPPRAPIEGSMSRYRRTRSGGTNHTIFSATQNGSSVHRALIDQPSGFKGLGDDLTHRSLPSRHFLRRVHQMVHGAGNGLKRRRTVAALLWRGSSVSMTTGRSKSLSGTGRPEAYDPKITIWSGDKRSAIARTMASTVAGGTASPLGCSASVTRFPTSSVPSVPSFNGPPHLSPRLRKRVRTLKRRNPVPRPHRPPSAVPSPRR